MNNSRWTNFKFNHDTGLHRATCSLCGRVQEFRDKVALQLDCAKKCEAEWERRTALAAKEEAASESKSGLLF
jgi:hypothetical protein